MQWIVVIHQYTTRMTITYKGPFATRPAAEKYVASISPGEFPGATGIVASLEHP